MTTTTLIPLAIAHSLLMSAGQVLLKFSLAKMHPFGWTLDFWKSFITNWQFMLCGLCYGSGTLLWFYIIKNFPLSQACPMVSIGYIFGMVAAIVFFHEPVDGVKWLGVFAIMLGCYLITR